MLHGQYGLLFYQPISWLYNELHSIFCGPQGYDCEELHAAISL